MTIQVEEMISACEVIARQENLDVCITESFKGAAIAGTSAFVCGILMGPVGVAIGGTIGGLAGSACCKSYKHLWQILSEMSRQDKLKFYDHMLRITQSLEITDAMLLMSIIANPSHVARATILKEVINYFGAAIAPAVAGQIYQQ